MIKAKEYDWKDSNMALFGSDTDKSVKKDAAITEPAWEGAGSKCGIQIWRIVQFKVTDWPEKDYGQFFEDDSYIILNTYTEKDSDELQYDVHFWIGKGSSQDEYGTAAYKTVELDAFLDDKAIQHREVMNRESALFKSYFSTLTHLKGGAESGFNRVEPKEYEPRLFHYSKKKGKQIMIKQVSLCRENLSSTDVFVLDMGLRVFQWNGSTSSGTERYAAASFIQGLKTDRNNPLDNKVIDEDDDNNEFYSALTGEMDEADDETEESTAETKLYKLSDMEGELKLTEVKTGPITESDLSSDDVYFIDTRKEMFVWLGSKASIEERRNAMSRSHDLLKTTDHPLVPVSVYPEGSSIFWKQVSPCM